MASEPRPTFNVAQLLKEPVGSTRSGEISVDVRDIVPELVPLEAAGAHDPVDLSGLVRLMHTTDGVLVQGHLSGTVALRCSRCLERVNVPLDITLEDTFAPTIDIHTGQFVQPEEEDKALWIDAHHILDLSEVMRQDVLLALPLHVLCRADCQGLCPTCGKNLNEGPCDCVAEPDPRWSVLADLLKDSSPDDSNNKE